MKVIVDAHSRTFLHFWLVPLGIVLAGYAIYSARTALIILGSALFLALALNSPVSRLAKHLPGKSRAGSTAIAFVVVVALLGSFLFLAVPPIIQQTAKFLQTVPSLVEGARTEWRGLNSFINQYNLQPQVDSALATTQENATKWASNFGSNVIVGLGSFFSFLAASILSLVLAFLMLIEGPTWMRRIWGLYNDTERMEQHRTVVQRIHGVVSGYVTGQLTVSALGALTAGVTVFALSFFFNLPSNLAVPAAAITFILSLVPMFGATIGGIIIAVLLVFNDPAAAIAYVVYFVVYQQIENNYISPRIQSKRLELSPLAVLASVTVGLYLFGIAGGIISIPIAGSIKVLLDTYLEQARKQREKKDLPIHKLVKKVKNEA